MWYLGFWQCPLLFFICRFYNFIYENLLKLWTTLSTPRVNKNPKLLVQKKKNTNPSLEEIVENFLKLKERTVVEANGGIVDVEEREETFVANIGLGNQAYEASYVRFRRRRSRRRTRRRRSIFCSGGFSRHCSCGGYVWRSRFKQVPNNPQRKTTKLIWIWILSSELSVAVLFSLSTQFSFWFALLCFFAFQFQFVSPF